MGKKGEFSFVWLFALIVGGAILFFAIYGAVKASDTQRLKTDTQSAAELAILTDPLQAGFSQGSFGSITFTQETKIFNNCLGEGGEFGRNELSVATRSSVGNEWNLPGVPSRIYSKYVFSKEEVQGKKFYVFSKPFSFPYEVSDLIFLSSENYCFREAPESMREEMEGLGVSNVEFDDDCEGTYESVCFGVGASCDILVIGFDSAFSVGKVVRGGDELNYAGSLLYGAIFSDARTYRCNVNRLMYRTGLIARTLAQKADVMDSRNCGSNLGSSMLSWSSMVNSYSGGDFTLLKETSDRLERDNTREVCGLWE